MKRSPVLARVARVVGFVGFVAAFGPGLVLPAPARAAAPAATTQPVTATIQLSKRAVRAGSTLRGNLVLTNHTGKTVNLNTGCRPQWQVVLGQGKDAPPVAFTLVCGPEPFNVQAGTTKLKFELSTSYAGCAPDAASVSADRPRCRSNGRPPPLPRGRYHAFLVANDPSFPPATPAAVRIVRLLPSR